MPLSSFGAGPVFLSGDVNDDGRDDLVVLWNNGGVLTAQVSTSDGVGFTQVSNNGLGAPFSASDRLMLLDVNADAKADLLRIYQSGTSTQAQVLLSDGTTFTSASDAFVGGYNPANVYLVMDVDGDRRSDLVILWNNGGTLTCQVNTGNGTGFVGWVSNDTRPAVAASRSILRPRRGRRRQR